MALLKIDTVETITGLYPPDIKKSFDSQPGGFKKMILVTGSNFSGIPLIFQDLWRFIKLGMFNLCFYQSLFVSGVLVVKLKLKDNVRMFRGDTHLNFNLAFDHKQTAENNNSSEINKQDNKIAYGDVSSWMGGFVAVPTFDTKVTEYLCSGWVFFSSDKFRLFN